MTLKDNIKYLGLPVFLSSNAMSGPVGLEVKIAKRVFNIEFHAVLKVKIAEN